MSATRSFRATLLPLLGVVLACASALGLFAFASIMLFIADANVSTQVWLDYGLLLLSLVCALVAGISMIWSWIKDRQRDVVPGPTLYLLGLFILALSLQALLTSVGWLPVLGVVAGLAVIAFEYRSEWL
ncbi:MAG: hypothetical protein AAF270_03825 [Pseudomonadota bacterium]